MRFDKIEDVYSFIDKSKALPNWIVNARQYHGKMKALIYGDEFKTLLLRIEHIETADKAKARNNYSRSIKDVNLKLLAPVNNVYSATGGGKSYDIESSEQLAGFVKELSNVRSGLSIERWLETFWSQDLYVVDPSGLIFLEWKDEKAFPTYKSIDTIHNYISNGQKCECVLFSPVDSEDKKYKIWRIVDDEKDYLIRENGAGYLLIKETPHTFGKCPAVINSDIHRIGQKERLSPIDRVIETEQEILRDRSILTIYKFLNGFAIPYRPQLVCPTCQGLGKHGDDECGDCNGKGYLGKTDVVNEITLPVNMDSENGINLPSNFAGYISPDLKIWDQYITEGNRLFNECFESIWGTRESEQVKDQTAMGVILNTQPMITRLNKWSNVAQSVEYILTEMLANFYIPTKDKNKRVSIISYGRNYIIQPPEYLLDSYQKSKKNGDSSTILDRKLIEYITSKYKYDPSTLAVELKKKVLEPYIHYTIEQVNTIFGNQEAQKKGIFNDWWETITIQDHDKETEALKKNRDEYYKNHLIIKTENNE